MDELKEILGIFADDFDIEALTSDSRSFHELHKAITMAPSTSIEFVPQFIRLVKLLLTLPYSTASAERSFSVLKRLKTWLRSTMGQARLSYLAICQVHQSSARKLMTANLVKEFISRTMNDELFLVELK